MVQVVFHLLNVSSFWSAWDIFLTNIQPLFILCKLILSKDLNSNSYAEVFLFSFHSESQLE